MNAIFFLNYSKETCTNTFTHEVTYAANNSLCACGCVVRRSAPSCIDVFGLSTLVSMQCTFLEKRTNENWSIIIIRGRICDCIDGMKIKLTNAITHTHSHTNTATNFSQSATMLAVFAYLYWVVLRFRINSKDTIIKYCLILKLFFNLLKMRENHNTLDLHYGVHCTAECGDEKKKLACRVLKRAIVEYVWKWIHSNYCWRISFCLYCH